MGSSPWFVMTIPESTMSERSPGMGTSMRDAYSTSAVASVAVSMTVKLHGGAGQEFQ